MVTLISLCFYIESCVVDNGKCDEAGDSGTIELGVCLDVTKIA